MTRGASDDSWSWADSPTGHLLLREPHQCGGVSQHSEIQRTNFFKADLPWYAEDAIFLTTWTIIGTILVIRDMKSYLRRLYRRAQKWDKDADTNSD